MSESWVNHFKAMAKKAHKSRKFMTLKQDESPSAGLPVSIISPAQQAVHQAEYNMKNAKKRRKDTTSIKRTGGSTSVSVLD